MSTQYDTPTTWEEAAQALHDEAGTDVMLIFHDVGPAYAKANEVLANRDCVDCFGQSAFAVVGYGYQVTMYHDETCPTWQHVLARDYAREHGMDLDSLVRKAKNTRKRQRAARRRNRRR